MSASLKSIHFDVMRDRSRPAYLRTGPLVLHLTRPVKKPSTLASMGPSIEPVAGVATGCLRDNPEPARNSFGDNGFQPSKSKKDDGRGVIARHLAKPFKHCTYSKNCEIRGGGGVACQIGRFAGRPVDWSAGGQKFISPLARACPSSASGRETRQPSCRCQSDCGSRQRRGGDRRGLRVEGRVGSSGNLGRAGRRRGG